MDLRRPLAVGLCVHNRHGGAHGDAQRPATGQAGEQQRGRAEIVLLKLNPADFRCPPAVRQEDVAAGGQGSSLLFTMVPGGWCFGHGSP